MIFRSWNLAAHDNRLWELQYVVLYGSAAKQQPRRLAEDRNDKLLQKTIDTGTITEWKEAVKGAYTGKQNVDFLHFKRCGLTWFLFSHPTL